jgi:LuxR family maltose regulon positive regulatory protein
MRGIALHYQIGAYQLVGQLDKAYEEVHKALAEDRRYGGAIAHRIYISLMCIEALAGNWRGAEQTSIRLENLAQARKLYVSIGWALECRGHIYYQWNELEEAHQCFLPVLKIRYQISAEIVLQNLAGLALTYQAMGKPNEARETSESAITWARETGGAQMLIRAYSLASRLALLQGQVPDTKHWAVPLGDTLPLMLLYEIPHLTLARVLIARGTPSALIEATDLLARLGQSAEATHNTWRMIEIMTLQALVHDAQGEQETALTLLGKAVELAEPGGCLRLFADLGPPMARLLAQLRRQGVAPDYIAQILAAFPTETKTQDSSFVASPLARRPSSPPVLSQAEGLVEPLTRRELEVLTLLARHLTNREIAEELVISPGTVKTHTLRIYRKIDVRGRQQAVARAKELDIL